MEIEVMESLSHKQLKPRNTIVTRMILNESVSLPIKKELRTKRKQKIMRFVMLTTVLVTTGTSYCLTRKRLMR